MSEFQIKLDKSNIRKGKALFSALLSGDGDLILICTDKNCNDLFFAVHSSEESYLHGVALANVKVFLLDKASFETCRADFEHIALRDGVFCVKDLVDRFGGLFAVVDGNTLVAVDKDSQEPHCAFLFVADVPQVITELIGDRLYQVVYPLLSAAEFFEFHRQFFPVLRGISFLDHFNSHIKTKDRKGSGLELNYHHIYYITLFRKNQVFSEIFSSYPKLLGK